MERLARIGRGAVRRCPRCGGGNIFSTFFTLRDRCPNCGFNYTREEGYWLGAMIVNIGVTEALFGLVFIGSMVATWPDVPWNWLLVAGLVINAVVPVVFYPFSKTIWLGLDLFFNPPTVSEEADAAPARDPRWESGRGRG